jgi:hypothetical protein
MLTDPKTLSVTRRLRAPIAGKIAGKFAGTVVSTIATFAPKPATACRARR